MSKWRIGAIAAVVVFAALTVRVIVQQPEPPPAPAPPAREQFHAAKPLLIAIAGDDAPWLGRELRNMLLRGRMRLASDDSDNKIAFKLHIELAPTTIKATLLAPDGVVERSLTLAPPNDTRLARIRELARRLPEFLEATPGGTEWTAFPGTDDADAYEQFLVSADELFSAAGSGFTEPRAERQPGTVDRLERLTRQQPEFGRASALLALGYLNLGGEDEASLTQIAESAAQRALALDPASPNAQSALGLANLREGRWVAAKEHLDAALALDAESLPALEGSAVLLMNAGQAANSLPLAHRALALQKDNVGANTSLAYAQVATGQKVDADPDNAIPEVAYVKALVALLSGAPEDAQNALNTNPRLSKATWTQPLLDAAMGRGRKSDALRAITFAASDGGIDASTEILAGAALRQSDFVFNRMSRLYKQEQSLPLRILWLPQTDFLRRNPRFEQVVNAAGLLPFWQEHGVPDICGKEPAIHGCKLSTATIPKGSR